MVPGEAKVGPDGVSAIGGLAGRFRNSFKNALRKLIYYPNKSYGLGYETYYPRPSNLLIANRGLLIAGVSRVA